MYTSETSIVRLLESEDLLGSQGQEERRPHAPNIF